MQRLLFLLGKEAITLIWLVAAIVGAVGIYLWRDWRYSKRLRKNYLVGTRKPVELVIDTIPDQPANFGYKISWLAVKSLDTESVARALPIESLRPANWRSGIQAAYNEFTFVSPPVNGWVLVISGDIPEIGTHELEAVCLLKALSKEFGEVQFFGSHRIVGYVSWAMFRNGAELRAFEYVGETDETRVNRGQVSDAEVVLSYSYLDPNYEYPVLGLDGTDNYLSIPSEEHVLEVAEKWSINPCRLENVENSEGLGWVGTLSRKSLTESIGSKG